MASVEIKNTEGPAIPLAEGKPEIDGSSPQDMKNTEFKRRPRRKVAKFRTIPRSPTTDKENKGHRMVKGMRQRTTSVSSVTSTRSQRRGGKSGRRRTNSEASSISEASEASPLRKLRDTVMEKFEKKGLNLLNSFIKNRMELAKFDNTTNFLERCDVLQLVPNKYRLSNAHIKNTKHVIRELDRYSYNIMFADLKYNRKRRFQVNKLLSEKEDRMREMFGAELVTEILQVAGEAFDRRFNRIRDQQAKIYESLLKEYEITDQEKAEGEERLKRMEEREKTRQERRAQEKLAEGQADEKAGGDDKPSQKDADVKPSEDAEKSSPAVDAEKTEDSKDKKDESKE